MSVKIRHVPYQQVVSTVSELFVDACHNLPDDVVDAIRSAMDREESQSGQHILKLLLDNAHTARTDMIPLCQDTGVAVVFVEQGNRAFADPPEDNPDATLLDAINEGVADGYGDGFLRMSMVGDPISKRENTRTNTPAVIHHEYVPGDQIKITVMPKGGGCENKSQFVMLTPAQGEQGVKDFVVSVVAKAGADACPPFVVGVGVGGDFEKSCILSKKALLRRLDQRNEDPYYAALEKELLERVNNTGVGPQGFGGRVTALGLAIEASPCHIASLPVAVNIECHSHRHKSAVL